jgi:branched-chain amino acid aminotransferase
MAQKKELRVWLDGGLVKWSGAYVPIMTHPLQYGSGIFEGIRAYNASKGVAIFRLADHVKRFMNSARIYSMDLGYSAEELEKAIRSTVKANNLKSCYIRPFAFYNDQNIGLATQGKKISVYVAAVPFGDYYGEGKERGISCNVSSWRRINSGILPPEAKCSGNYVNSILANSEAKAAGADEAIMLSSNGHVAEGSADNIFIVRDGRIITPSKDADILLGITRDSVIKLAEYTGLEVEERGVHREELYTCDEAFLTGTAAEITPVVKIDSRKVGNGKPGPITKVLSGKYSDATMGKNSDFAQWLDYI